MKILDRYILTTYLKTFLSVFIILMLIFVLQGVWLYISELAGKDLDVVVIAKFLIYLTPTLIPLILPLTILLTSIMVFGNFAENYEFAAMKSTGISLQRAMRSLSIFIVILGVTTFFFSNNVIPWAQFNSYNLRKNIAKLKPAMFIAEGQFNEMGDINIKVSKLSGDKNQFLENVVMHKKPSKGVGNKTVIMSKAGELVSSEDSNIIKLILKDGWYYEDITQKKYKEKQKQPFVKSEFKQYTINIDLNQGDVDLEEKEITSKYNMLGIQDLDYTIDSLLVQKTKNYSDFSKNVYNRTSINKLNNNIKIKDSSNLKKTDSIYTGSIVDLFPKKNTGALLEQAINLIQNTTQMVSAKDSDITDKNKWLNKHVYAFHEKFTLALSCIILFFVGAPLGALIKKGGIGLPMVVAILLFLTYHFMSLFARNSGYNGKIDPVFSAWLPSLVMLPLSIYLTRAATLDQPLVSFDFIAEPIKRVFASKEILESEELLDKNSEEFKTLINHDNDKLIDIVKNYHQYNFNEKYRNSALKILNDRGITKQELKFSGNLTNQTYEEAKREMKLYLENSRVAVASYFIYAVFLILGLVFNNNGYPALAVISFILFSIAFLGFVSYISKSFYNASNFYKKVGNKNPVNFLALAFVLIGIPLYFVVHLYFSKKLKEDINLIS